nr:uncharacterized protein LOC106686186 isoform X2 [Halyomorpha halys]
MPLLLMAQWTYILFKITVLLIMCIIVMLIIIAFIIFGQLRNAPGILILLLVYASVALADEEIGSPLRVAQCRARCIQKFGGSDLTSERSCLKGSDCKMCWENCQLLQSNFPVWGAICDEKGICFPGCKEACQFHVESEGGQRVPVIQTRGEGVIRVSGGVASWPRPARPHGPFVYVLMRRLGDRPWRQISQGLSTSARVPDGGVLRVLVVDRNGLVTIYSPGSKSGLEEARGVLESMGRTDLLAPLPPPSQGKRINTEIALPTTSIPTGILEDRRSERRGWTLREVSLIHQKVLVIAEIAWEARRLSRRPVYFVTWEVDGGGLKGNLFTDSTSVTLSLWPDTVYHIQVELVRHGREESERSEELVVDTGRAVGVEWEDGPRREPSSGDRNELALGAAAAVILFGLILAALLLVARQRRRPKMASYTPANISRGESPYLRIFVKKNG